jgi:hypothetical protein
MSQLTLEQAATQPDDLARIRRRPPREKRQTIQERFEAFHRANPGVYTLLVELARDVKARGKSTYGMKAIFERARWFYHIERGDEDFKLNNSYTAFYSRIIMLQERDLEGFFTTREQRFEG